MWKPPDRILYKSSYGHVPTSEDAEKSLLFQPVKIGNQSLKEKTWVPAMVPWRADPDGMVNDNVLSWYKRFAEGRPGVIVVEATGIRDIPSGPLLRIGDDRYISGLKKLVEAVRKASAGETKIFIQLIDFLTVRRRPAREKYFQQFLKVSQYHKENLGDQSLTDQDVCSHLLSLDDGEVKKILSPREFETLTKGYRETVSDMGLEHIRNLPEVLPALFAAAGCRAEQAGFDGVELHYAHAYTMASFLSARNTRDDRYGGKRENRIRLPLEVFKKVRASVGKDFVVGCRFLTEECIEGGSELSDSIYFAKEFAKAGFDFLSTSRGGKFEDAAQPSIGDAVYPYTGQSGFECMPHRLADTKGTFGRNIEPTNKIRCEVHKINPDIPVVVAGGIHNFEQAEDILRGGSADIIGAARQSLADPDWFMKTREGRAEDIRLCEYTNYCEGLDQKHKQVTCKLWDRSDLDAPGVSKSSDGKRRLTAP